MRRGDFEIKVDILRAIADGKVKVTQIMQSANMQYTSLKRKIGFLIEKGLIENRILSNSRQTFHLTKKGQIFLYDAQELLALLEA